MTSRFDLDTAVEARGDGSFDARFDLGWWIARGPNGGYVAAVVLRALTESVADAERPLRSLTVHYLAPPVEGAVRIETVIERKGRHVTFVSARAYQDQRLLVIAVAAFGRPFVGPTYADAVMPAAPPADGIVAVDSNFHPLGGPPIPMRARYDMRWAIGPAPFSGERAGEIGGWLRLTEPRPYDALLLTAMTDSWLPVTFLRLAEPLQVPTIDLTVHIRAPQVVIDDLDPNAHLLCVFRSRTLADGYVEEDGELWSPGGVLLAQSRQLAVTFS